MPRNDDNDLDPTFEAMYRFETALWQLVARHIQEDKLPIAAVVGTLHVQAFAMMYRAAQENDQQREDDID